MARLKIFTKKNLFILFLLSILTIGVVSAVKHVNDTAENLANTQTHLENANILRLVAAVEQASLEQENMKLQELNEYKVVLKIKEEFNNNKKVLKELKDEGKKIEYITADEQTGFIQKTLPSLSRTDYWHYHNKFVGNRRSGKLELQDPIKGNICELTFSPK